MITRRAALMAIASPLLPSIGEAAPNKQRRVRLPAVPRGYIAVGQKKGVPPAILFAVAVQESKMRFGAYALPYPWTLNVQKKPERFRSYHQAVAALEHYLRRGITNIDTCLMQINWRYHSKRLVSAARAMNPYPNLEVGGDLLREHYDETNDWFAAVGRYHNGNLEIGVPYARSVFGHLAQIPGVTAEARYG